MAKRFIFILFCFFLSSLLMQDAGEVWGKGVAKAGKKAAKGAKKTAAKAKKAATKAKKTASKAATKAKKTASKAATKAKKTASKAATKAKKTASKAASKAKVVASEIAQDPNKLIGAIQTGRSLAKGDLEGAAENAAGAAGQRDAFNAAKGTVKAAKDGDWESAAGSAVTVGAAATGRGDELQAVEGLAQAVKLGDDETVVQAVSQGARQRAANSDYDSEQDESDSEDE